MAEAPAWTAKQVDEIVAAHASLEGPLLPILHAVQAAIGYVPRDAVPIIAHALNLTRAEVYGVVSFYHDFRDAPAGRRVVKLCRAEACQSMGGVAVADAVLKHFAIGWGETTADGAVTIEPIYCLGLCSVAPSALVDGEPHGRVEAKHLITLAEHGP
jgi:formate dehydrogenase subunit gamma